MLNCSQTQTKFFRIIIEIKESQIKCLKYCHQATTRRLPVITLSRQTQSTQMTSRSSSARFNSVKEALLVVVCHLMRSIESIACILVAYSAKILMVSKLRTEIILTKAFLRHLYNRITSSMVLRARAKRRMMVCRWREEIPWEVSIALIQIQKSK